MATLLEDFRCRVDAADHHLFSDVITRLSAVKVTSVVDFTFLDADDLQMIFDGNTALLRVAEHTNVACSRVQSWLCRTDVPRAQGRGGDTKNF